MKAISLWQPWASLISTGAKTFETRGWKTHYRGKLVICAAKGGLSKSDLADFVGRKEFQIGLAPLLNEINSKSPIASNALHPDQLPFGAAVCLVELTSCISTDVLPGNQYLSEKEFGDYSPGRYAWKLKLIERFAKPIPVKGKQGFFEVVL